jgi:hypothetical protein
MVIQWDEPETPNGQVTVGGRSDPFFLLSHGHQWKKMNFRGIGFEVLNWINLDQGRNQW